MRGAPQVTLPAGRSLLAFGLPLALLVLGLGLTALWAWQAPGPGPIAGLAAWLAYALLFVGRWPATGVLSWDGSTWHWWPDAPRAAPAGSIGACEVLPEVALDLQGLILLRLRRQAETPPDGTTPWGRRAHQGWWLWLTPAGDPGRWLTFRRALYSRSRRMAG